MISILINNYNYGRFLSEAIDSILHQTYDRWELIIVDDGSTDDSRDVIEDYTSKHPDRIRAILKENGGQASCFNNGFEAASGDVIAFLDSDDYWYPNKLEMIAKAHESHEYVAHGKKYSNGALYKVDTIDNDKRSYYLRKYGVFDSYDLTTSVVSISRSLAEKIFPMPEKEYMVCADHYVKMVALYYSNICYLPEELSFYRIHGENAYVSKTVSHRADTFDKQLDFISVEYFNDKLKKSGIDEKLLPHRSSERTREFYREIGRGFEIRNGMRYVVYGTGTDSWKMAEWIITEGGEIVAFCDSSEEKQGERHLSRQIWKPEELIENKDGYDKIVIGSMRYYREIEEILQAMGLKRGDDYIYTPVY